MTVIFYITLILSILLLPVVVGRRFRYTRYLILTLAVNYTAQIYLLLEGETLCSIIFLCSQAFLLLIIGLYIEKRNVQKALENIDTATEKIKEDVVKKTESFNVSIAHHAIVDTEEKYKTLGRLEPIAYAYISDERPEYSIIKMDDRTLAFVNIVHKKKTVVTKEKIPFHPMTQQEMSSLLIDCIMKTKREEIAKSNK